MIDFICWDFLERKDENSLWKKIAFVWRRFWPCCGCSVVYCFHKS